MKKVIYFVLHLIFCALTSSLTAQSGAPIEYSFTENTGDRDKFLMYTDTIDKYLYRDSKITEHAIEASDAILRKNTPLSNVEILNYITQKVYFELNKGNPLTSFQLLNDFGHLSNGEDIPNKTKNSFIYIKGFTSMILGDLVSAQKTYYDLLERGKATKDTSLIIQGSYALGQIYSDDKKYESAINYFLQLVDLKEQFYIRPTTQSLIDYELCEAYISTEQFDQAIEVIEKQFIFLEEEKIDVLKPDFLILRGEIALRQQDTQKAQEVFEEVTQLAARTDDPQTLRSFKLFHAEFLDSRKQFDQALEIYDSLIAQSDSTDFNRKLTYHKKAYELCHKRGNDAIAFRYSSAYNVIKEKAIRAEKEQQTTYLKIKFESEQKEKENQALAVQVIQKQNQNKLLYLLIAFVISGTLVLFWAFSQKKKYNQTLQKQVKSRTQELEISNAQLKATNKELDEFNRILSHDLKEPLRSIVSFSSLVIKENTGNAKINEYMRLVEKSGQQLNQIIKDISIYQNIKTYSSKAAEWVDVNSLVEVILPTLQKIGKAQTIKINFEGLPKVFTKRLVLGLIIENLLQNGITFNESELPEVSIRYYEKDHYHFFEFADNGIGIPSKFHDRIFGMFKRLNTRDVYSGSGLGLSIAQKMIGQIDGTIRVVQSVEKQGSIFQISFPVLASTKGVPTKADPAAVYS